MTKIVSWNIKGSFISSQKEVAARIKQEAADIAVIQEALVYRLDAPNDVLKKKFANLAKMSGFPLSFIYPSKRGAHPGGGLSNTIGTMSMVAPKKKGVIKLSDKKEVLLTEYSDTVIINVHLDTKEDANLSDTGKLLETFAQYDPCMIIGDFNFHKEDAGYAAMIAAGYSDWTSQYDRRDKVFVRGALKPSVVTLDASVDNVLSDHPIVTATWSKA